MCPCLQHYLHHHQMMMMPGLTEEECHRYRELLQVKCQYEKQQRETDTGAGGPGEQDQEASSSVVPDVSGKETLSEHEMALIDEELRHLEFKCRNILRAQKMQQLRERCLKAWMMEEEAAAAGAGPPEAGNHDDHPARVGPHSSCGAAVCSLLQVRRTTTRRTTLAAMSCRPSTSCRSENARTTRTPAAPTTREERAAGARHWSARNRSRLCTRTRTKVAGD